jgi:hypothetical protein
VALDVETRATFVSHGMRVRRLMSRATEGSEYVKPEIVKALGIDAGGAIVGAVVSLLVVVVVEEEAVLAAAAA